MDPAIAIQLLLNGLDRLAAWGVAIAKAQAEGRALTEEEVDAFFLADDQAKKMLEDAIVRRGG
jgi:hypothetical protein